MNRMNRLTAIMAALGAFGTGHTGGLYPEGRVAYPYTMGARHPRVGRQPQHCKKGPGRGHVQGKATPVRRFERKLRTCSR